MNARQATDILKRYSANDCTAAEKQLIDAWYDELVITGDLQWQEGEKESLQAAMETGLLQSITDEEVPVLPEHRAQFTGRKMWWAAAAVLICSAGAYYLFNQPQKVTAVENRSAGLKNDVAPGSNKAMLTLANGETIVLDVAANGTIAQQGNLKIVKLNNGQLAYTSDDSDKQLTIDHSPPDSYRETFNTLTTPRSGQYQLVLPDGSKVWLNASSSIHYPVAFTGNERKVQLTGEAYFEVVHNSRMPFIVDILPSGAAGEAGGRIEVLGTHFNVNAYNDEQVIKTTLLEGKVKVVNGQWSMVNGQSALSKVERSAILKPGEQASLSYTSHASHNISVQTVDLDDIMAWKNGLFHFENSDIRTVMRQLARWYDVEIVYKRSIENSDPLFVEISRNTNLSDVLKALEISGTAKFSIQGKKIIVN